jgi:hypothetical protein
MQMEPAPVPPEWRVLDDYAAGHSEVFGGWYVGGIGEPKFVTLWTEAPARHGEALSNLLGQPVGTRQVRWTERHLQAVFERVEADLDALERGGLVVAALGTLPMDNVVEVDVTDLTEEQRRMLLARYGECLQIRNGRVVAATSADASAGH